VTVPAQPRVVVLGSINVDLGVRVPAFPQPGETVAGGDLVISPGGKGANQAVAAALTGADVALVGAVGTDRFAEAALAGLHRAGVDVSRVRAVEGATGTALITVDGAGENTIIVSPGGNGQVSEADADVTARLLDRPAVLVLQGEIDPRVVDRAAALVQERPDCRLLVNAAPVTDLALATFQAARPLVVNESEARLVSQRLRAGREEGAVDGGDSLEEMSALAVGLVEWGVPSVVLTLGAQGCLAAERVQPTGTRASRFAGGAVVVRVIDPVSARAVDTTGAGDMFVGALAAHLAAGRSLAEAAHDAGARASATVAFPGAQSSYFAAEGARPG
jgi:ribokinase